MPSGSVASVFWPIAWKKRSKPAVPQPNTLVEFWIWKAWTVFAGT